MVTHYNIESAIIKLDTNSFISGIEFIDKRKYHDLKKIANNNDFELIIIGQCSNRYRLMRRRV